MKINRPDMAWYLEQYHDVLVPHRRQSKVKCPWHDDRTPSAVVYRDSHRFVCYSGCFGGRAVDVLDIVQETSGLSFSDAVALTADWPGTEVESSESSHARSTRSARNARANRKPFSFKILEA